MKDKFITERGHAFATSWDKTQEHFAEYSYELIEKASEDKERIIREMALEGFKYLLIKTDTVFEDNKATMKFKYKGINELGKDAIRMFEGQGVEVYSLDKVREYIAREVYFK